MVSTRLFSMQKTELVIFDCDGVLIDSEIVVCRIAAEELTRIGYPITTEQVMQRFAGRPDREMRDEIEQDWGRPLAPEYTRRVNTRTEEAYSSELRIMPGVLTALDAIEVPICVASSSFPVKLRLGLEVVGLYDRFAPNIISASIVARGKPEPDVFNYAAGWMHTAPANCLVIEDGVAGVTSARRAGMRVFGFDGGAHCSSGHRERLLAAGAELAFSKMEELPQLIAPQHSRQLVR
jgi:HAD superfamily hydrolase (TIGR01509 family)